MEAKQKPMRVAVIGAGLAGLAAAKELLEAGHTPLLLDSNESVGGVFSLGYEGLFLTTSTSHVMYSDFRVPKEESRPRYMSGKDYGEYLASYWRHFRLPAHTRLHTKVLRVQRKAPQQWLVYTRDTHDGSERCEEVQRVVVASGSNRMRKCAKPASLHLDNYSGRILHASDFVNASDPIDVAGKRVLIVGGGEYASDLVELCAQRADLVGMSTRTGTGYIIPRMFGEMPADADTSRHYHMMPRFLLYYTAQLRNWVRTWLSRGYAPDARKQIILQMNAGLLRRGLDWGHTYGTKTEAFVRAVVDNGAKVYGGIAGASGKLVRFEDGSEQEFDIVYAAIGYRQHFHFLEQDFPELEQKLVTDLRHLFKNVIAPEIGPELFFCGFARPAVGSVTGLAELQARWFALLCSGKRTCPPPAEMERIAQLDRRRLDAQFARDMPKKAWLRDNVIYADELAALIGCNAPLVWLFCKHPRVWLHAMFGPMIGSQYRLRGPGAKTEQALADLARTPFARLQNIVCVLALLIPAWCFSFVSRRCAPVIIRPHNGGVYGILPGGSSDGDMNDTLWASSLTESSKRLPHRFGGARRILLCAVSIVVLAMVLARVVVR